MNAVIDHFRRRSHLPGAARRRDQPDTYIDITHESLIRQWKKLRDEWVPEERRSAKTLLDLAHRAANGRRRKESSSPDSICPTRARGSGSGIDPRRGRNTTRGRGPRPRAGVHQDERSHRAEARPQTQDAVGGRPDSGGVRDPECPRGVPGLAGLTARKDRPRPPVDDAVAAGPDRTGRPRTRAASRNRLTAELDELPPLTASARRRPCCRGPLPGSSIRRRSMPLRSRRMGYTSSLFARTTSFECWIPRAQPGRCRALRMRT